uniref:BMERB domain-containing protein n=1 Tax=Anolis carolinensis TaxID=28377 RepID=A0A803T0Z8_ANOCA
MLFVSSRGWALASEQPVLFRTAPLPGISEEGERRRRVIRRGRNRARGEDGKGEQGVHPVWIPGVNQVARSRNRQRMDDIQLCKEISRLKKELQKLIALPENKKSKEEKKQEEELVQQIHKLVETRDFLVDDVEFERLREREEDKEMAEFLKSKLSKTCLPKATPAKEKKMMSKGQQTSTPYVTKTGLTLLKECCGFTCSVM